MKKLFKKINLLFRYYLNKKIYSHNLGIHSQLSEHRKIDMKNVINKQIEKYLLKDHEKEKFILVEVGSYLGESLEFWGDILEEKIKDNFLIISIDPYSSYSSQEDKIKHPNKSRSVMKMSRSIEKTYIYFKHNISLKKWHNKHINLRVNSMGGYKILKNLNIKIDFCYIDGSHYYENFKFDLENYYTLLKSTEQYKGIICGDDYEMDYNDLLKKFNTREANEILNKNKKTDCLIYNDPSIGNFLFHPGITLAMKETKIKIKRFSSGFFIGLN